MAETIEFDIVTQESAVFAADVATLTLPGVNGEMGVLPGHRPLVTLIQPGTVVATEASGTKHTFSVTEGFAELSDNKATLIVAVCEGASDIDVDEARKHFHELEKNLSDGAFETPEEMEREAKKLARARARFEAVELATGKKG